MTKETIFKVFKALYKTYGEEKAKEILGNIINGLSADALVTLKNDNEQL